MNAVSVAGFVLVPVADYCSGVGKYSRGSTKRGIGQRFVALRDLLIRMNEFCFPIGHIPIIRTGCKKHLPA